MEDQVEQNPTPQADAGGASTLDRLERYLAAQDAPDQTNPDTPDDSADESDVTPDGDGQQAQGPQLSTTDLAKLLKLDDNALDLDEEGNVRIKTKVDGVEGAAKLQDLVKSYQLQEHVDKKAREAAEREKALYARQQEADAQFAQQLRYAEGLANVAANQLLQEFQSIDWKALEQADPGSAALWRQKFQERQTQLRGVLQNIEQERSVRAHRSQMELQSTLMKEAERLPMLIPEWKDAEVAARERAEIRDWAIKAGYDPAEVDTISKAHHVAVLRKAMLADRIQSQRVEIENKVRKAPVLVKPGQPAQNSQAQTLQNLKHAVKKSGGKGKAIEAYLLATGKV